MLVSIIMPTFSQKRKYLKLAIKRILKQTHKEIELIIVSVKDDHKTLDILDTFDDSRIVIKQSNYALITHQMNLGAYAANGKYVIPGVGSDDCYYKKSIASLVKFAEAKEAILVYPDFDVGNSSLKIKRTKRCPEFNRKLLDKGCYICDDALVVREEYMRHLPMKNSDGKSRIWNVWKKISDVKENRNRILHIKLKSHIYRDHGDAVHRHGSQSKFRAIELKTDYSPQTNLKCKNIDNIVKRDFCIYIKDILYFVENREKFNFKKNVLFWDDDNIGNVRLVDGSVYNWCSSKRVHGILKRNNMKYVRMIDKDVEKCIIDDFEDDLLTELG